MFWAYALKYFTEQLNALKLDDDGITPMENFAGTTTYISLKTTTHGDVHFMSWIQDFKAIYLD